ncbi:hypothetical protein CEXT_407181 [Caerostris extrusa]|uniref:Uncharacterized protein n=1 Tax=Caerostris extrusa TaxID=172846 RepID=A0AAV4UPS9_CAEEX|nr:hypothetical protein CEXT_407181 [Caerostris extrusa]
MNSKTYLPKSGGGTINSKVGKFSSLDMFLQSLTCLEYLPFHVLQTSPQSSFYRQFKNSTLPNFSAKLRDEKNHTKRKKKKFLHEEEFDPGWCVTERFHVTLTMGTRSPVSLFQVNHTNHKGDWPKRPFTLDFTIFRLCL